MLRELLRRVDMMVILENRLDALVRLHTPLPPGKIGGAIEPGTPQNLRPETFYGPNAGLTEVLIPAGYVKTVYDPVFKLSADGKRYVPTLSDQPTTVAAPGMPFSLVFRAEPGKEDVLLKIASAYEAASMRRVPPPAFGPISRSHDMTVQRRDLLATGAGARRGHSATADAQPALQILRIGMTTSDLPTTGGIPDNGSEGGRFAGYTIYDALVNWDFTHTDTLRRPDARLWPQNGTSIPDNHLRWIFTLREGVRYPRRQP